MKLRLVSIYWIRDIILFVVISGVEAVKLILLPWIKKACVLLKLNIEKA